MKRYIIVDNAAKDMHNQQTISTESLPDLNLLVLLYNHFTSPLEQHSSTVSAFGPKELQRNYRGSNYRITGNYRELQGQYI